MNSLLEQRLHELADADPATVASVLESTRTTGKGAWMLLATCVGRLQEEAAPGDQVLERLAEEFSLHRSRIARLGRIYREALRPRLESDGDLILSEQAWYEIACEAAEPLCRAPLELLADAERRKREDPCFSTRKWKSALGLKGQGCQEPFTVLLTRLAGIEDDVVEEFAESRTEDRRELLAAAGRVVSKVTRLQDDALLPVARFVWNSEREECLAEYAGEYLAGALGLQPHRLHGRSITTLTWNPDRTARLLRAARSGEDPEWEPGGWEKGHFEMRHDSGRKVVLPLDYEVRRSSDGSFVGFDLILASEERREDPTPEPGVGVGRNEHWMIAPDGRTAAITTGLALAIGHTPEAMIGLPFHDFLAEDDATRSTLTALLQSGDTPPATALPPRPRIRCRAKGGASVELTLDPFLLSDPQGRRRGLMLTGLIPGLGTERVRFADELDADGSDDEPGWIMDAWGRTIFVTEELAASLGASPEEMCGESGFRFAIEPEESSKAFDLLRIGIDPGLATGGPSRRWPARRADGEIFTLPYELTTHYSRGGNFLGVSFGRPRSQPAPIARRTALLRDCVWIIDLPHLETDFISPELALALGSSAEEMIGTSSWPHITGQETGQSMADRISTGEAEWNGHEQLQRFLRRDGSPIDLFYRAEPVHSPDGTLTKVIGYFPAG